MMQRTTPHEIFTGDITMVSISQWLQDWSDACEYAAECVPDLSPFSLGEPYSAMLAVFALCILLWRLNEPRARQARRCAVSPEAMSESRASQLEELRRILAEMEKTAAKVDREAA